MAEYFGLLHLLQRFIQLKTLEDKFNNIFCYFKLLHFFISKILVVSVSLCNYNAELKIKGFN